MEMRRWRPEHTQQGNPHSLSIRQHVHSRAAVARFADVEGRVHVRIKAADDRPDKSFLTNADNIIFCAPRLWSDKLENGFFRGVEECL